ncbi:putative polysaccharide biosynthesis protein [Ectobacillus polymachus]|uniref:putative polysaccharide biosynthesis protein n=1 Tax=Ectobacillus polymachus TaxID=1508806 RepID=UPI003A8BD621
MEMKKQGAFWKGAIILTISGLIMKILSAFYRIPYQNIAGDLGFYIYQQVYPLYGLSIILATYGFPVVISKLISARLEDKDNQGAKEIVFVSFWFLMGIGLLFFVILFFGSHAIAHAMGDERLSKLLSVVAFSFLLMPFLSVARGYFQGFANMTPTAVSQVAEQTVRVSIIVLLSLLLVGIGADSYTVGAGAMLGSVIGSIVAIVILLYFLRNDIKSVFMQKWMDIPGKRSIIKIVIWQGMTICVSNLVLIFIQFVDSMSLYNLLVGTGFEENTAKLIKGVYDRGIPFIQLGTVVATSFSLTLIPIITGARMRGDHRFIEEKIQLAMKLTLTIGLAATAGLVCIIRPANIMLFQNGDGSDFLAILSLSILFSALSITSASVLQGLGITVMPALFAIIGAGIKYSANLWLIPRFGVKGAAIATVFALFCISACNIFVLVRKIPSALPGFRSIRSVGIAGLGMVLVIMLYMNMFQHFINTEHRLVATFEALSSVGLGGIIYLILIFKMNVFTDEEIGAVWKGGKIPLIFKK